MDYVDGLVQDCSIFSMLVVEILSLTLSHLWYGVHHAVVCFETCYAPTYADACDDVIAISSQTTLSPPVHKHRPDFLPVDSQPPRLCGEMVCRGLIPDIVSARLLYNGVVETVAVGRYAPSGFKPEIQVHIYIGKPFLKLL